MDGEESSSKTYNPYERQAKRQDRPEAACEEKKEEENRQ
jgi:hypothetical protein